MINACLDIKQNHWKCFGVYTHSEVMQKTNWTFEEVISPEQYSKYDKEWIERGINKVEGCCGITTEHIRYVSENNFLKFFLIIRFSKFQTSRYFLFFVV